MRSTRLGFSQVPRLARSVGSMDWAIRREFVIVVLLMITAEVGVRLLPLERAARLFRVNYSGAERIPSTPLETLPRWAWQRLHVVARVIRWWPTDGMCLRQSLVAGHRLRRLEPLLKLGVRRIDGRVEAHAWLEVAGKTLDLSSTLYEELPAPRR